MVLGSIVLCILVLLPNILLIDPPVNIFPFRPPVFDNRQYNTLPPFKILRPPVFYDEVTTHICTTIISNTDRDINACRYMNALLSQVAAEKAGNAGGAHTGPKM